MAFSSNGPGSLTGPNFTISFNSLKIGNKNNQPSQPSTASAAAQPVFAAKSEDAKSAASSPASISKPVTATPSASSNKADSIAVKVATASYRQGFCMAMPIESGSVMVQVNKIINAKNSEMFCELTEDGNFDVYRKPDGQIYVKKTGDFNANALGSPGFSMDANGKIDLNFG